MTGYKEILAFWFNEIQPPDWWQKNDAFDAQIRQRFGPVHRAACHGELWSWRQSDEGRLAEIIVLDQFSRNIFRGRKEAFSADPMALVLSQEALSRGVDTNLPAIQKKFLYMPLMHSESRQIHQQADRYFKQLSEEDYRFEQMHKAIIDRFGRYPHRNAILGRTSTAEEQAFLKEENSSF